MLSLKHKVARYVWIRFYKKFVNLGFAGPSKKNQTNWSLNANPIN